MHEVASRARGESFVDDGEKQKHLERVEVRAELASGEFR